MKMNMDENLLEVINRLSSLRPVFQNETDFKFALAWEIQKKFPDWSVRFEYKPPNLKRRIFVDLWIEGDETYAIELKYKTQKWVGNVKGESFNLLPVRAQDLGRYDFLKDVERLESIVSTHDNVKGYAIILTNDWTYWNLSTQHGNQNVPGGLGDEFRIHDGKIINGELTWHMEAGAGTLQRREKTITINGKYKLKWKNYSTVTNDGTSYKTASHVPRTMLKDLGVTAEQAKTLGSAMQYHGYGEFRYLFLEIKS